MSDRLPKSPAPVEASSFRAPRPGENFFTRRMPRRGALGTVVAAGAGITLALTEGPKIAAAAPLAKPRRQESPLPPDPTITYGPDGQPVGGVAGTTDTNPGTVNPAPGEGGVDVSPVREWANAQPVVDRATLVNLETGSEQDIVLMRAAPSSHPIKLNDEAKKALAEWGAEMMALHQKLEPIEYVSVPSAADSPYPEASWARGKVLGNPLTAYHNFTGEKFIGLVVAFPPNYSQYPEDIQRTIRANMASTFMSFLLTGDEYRDLTLAEKEVFQNQKPKLQYPDLFVV